MCNDVNLDNTLQTFLRISKSHSQLEKLKPIFLNFVFLSKCFQYLVTDSNEASAIYGSDSPLISKLSEVKLGGAQNIVLYRIGGEAAEIVDLFGADTLLATREETVAAGGKFNVYIGPEPSNALKSCIIIFQGDTIVYSNATGAIVDLGLFNIVGFIPITLVIL